MTISQMSATQPLLQNPPPARKNGLGRDEFLQLLVAQLKNQNPMSPLDGAEFAVQLAQFSQLENLIQLNHHMSQWAQMQQLVQAASLVGRRVQYQPLDSQQVRTGTITAVHFLNSGLALQVDGQTISTAQIHAILL